MSRTKMTSTNQESWTRVKERLRAELGEIVFTSWFARMELDAVEDATVRLSVPTRFLRSWIQTHYIDRVLAHWQQEIGSLTRAELAVRSAVIRPLIPKAKPAEASPPQGLVETGANGREIRMA